MLEKLHLKDFDKFYCLLENSFPATEIRSYENQKSSLSDDRFKIFVIYNEGKDELKGFITMWQIEDYGFIDYFAVAEKYRNDGLGSKILSGIESIYDGKIFLELEPPTDEITKKRIAFYEKNGYVLNDFEYALPSFEIEREPIPLLIMSLKETLNEEKFQKLKDILFRDVYDVR